MTMQRGTRVHGLCSVTLLATLGLIGTGCGNEKAVEDAPADTAAAQNVVTLTEAQVTNAGIAYGTVELRREAGVLEATAQIEPAADRVAKIGSRVPGRVIAVRAAVGDRVNAGQTVVILDSPDVGQAKADYLSALASATLARQTETRERQLFERRVSAEREWREAEAEATRADATVQAAENRLHALGLEDSELAALRTERHYSSTMVVRTPLSGVVAERNAAPGEMVEPMNPLLTVMDLRQVWTVVDVYEQNIRQVKVGQDVEVTTAAYPGEAFKGRVASIGALIEPQSRSTKVRVVLPNPGERLKPGMFATVFIKGAVPSTAERLFVPIAAVQRDGERSIAFVLLRDRTFAPRTLRVGSQAGDWVEVLEGLTAGERVVTTGAFLLKSELRKSELGEGEEEEKSTKKERKP
jgi:cobalt-zinc-cadmium efflux system membrane fusion protein